MSIRTIRTARGSGRCWRLAIKSLLGDVSKRGPVAVRERLSAALGREVTEAEVVTLTAGLSVDTLRGAVNWLPGAT